MSWAARVMPYLEASAAYDAWDFQSSFYDVVNRTAREAPIAAWTCPSRRNGSNLSGEHPSRAGDGQGAVGDYAGNTGEEVVYTLAAGAGGLVETGNGGVIVQARGEQVDGKWLWKSDIKFSNIFDGPSQVILVGEKHTPDGTLDTYPADVSIYNADDLYNHVRGGSPLEPIARNANDHIDCIVHNPTTAGGVIPDYCENFGSWHPGICQFAFCDGSVHPISVAIDLEVLRYLCHREDGNVLPHGEF